MHFDVLGERASPRETALPGKAQNRPQIDHGRLQLLAFFLRAGGRPVRNNPTTSRLGLPEAAGRSPALNAIDSLCLAFASESDLKGPWFWAMPQHEIAHA